MKKTWIPLLVGSVGLLAVFGSWAPSASAQVSQAGKPAENVDSPLGRACVVTLDPRADRGAEAAGESFKKTGVSAESTVEGTLEILNGQWTVLRDGSYDNWIPSDKVLMIRVSR